MNRNHFWKLVLVILVVVWAFYELYPPSGRNLVQVFRERAVGTRDPVFSNIVVQAQALQKKNPDRQYGNLLDAIGTNDITKYFPSFPAKEEVDPTRYS